ncbi:hypothetical protein M5K25_009815 [Dendrobium thyrsiflorum]|uniref:NB-ARC domain-containing protein n=1 Tax=Dendrobium thyrsiflorum TaxID=117978 RepID=A0ABD0VDS2_DENTH
MLESLKKERPRLDTLDALQNNLRTEIMFKKFFLVLDDIWEEDEEKDKSKWEDVLAPLASGGFGSKILVTTRTDSIALMFAKVIKKKEEIVKLEGLEEDECLQLLNTHAFAGVENPPDDHKKLRAIAGEIVKKLLGSPLAAKVIGGVLNDNLDEMHWSTVLESNLLGQNFINSILRLSYVVLPNHLQNCFALCCMFPQDHRFDKDDLVRMRIALGFIQPPHDQEGTMENSGERCLDVLVKISNLEKIKLAYCREWQTLPPLGQLPLLKSLKLSDMPKVKWLENKFSGNDKYRVFPLLEVLHVDSLKALEDLFEEGVVAEDGCLFLA